MKQFLPENELVDFISLVVMLCFVAVFVTVVFRAYRASRKSVQDHLAELPLLDDESLSSGDFNGQ